MGKSQLGGINMFRFVSGYTGDTTFIHEKFDEPVLYAPARIEQSRPCSSLKIVTAFTDCERISTHMIQLAEGMKNKRFVPDMSVDIILGMTKSSLSPKKHEDICRLLHFLNESREMPKVTCRYICQGPEVHTKLYLWSYPSDNPKDNLWGYPTETPINIPNVSYCGSLNYTMNAFYKRRETVSLCDSLEALKYYDELLKDTIDCFDPAVSERLKNVVNNTPGDTEDSDNMDLDYVYYDQQKPVAVIEVSLLRADGSDTGYGSGINWGIRKNGTKRNPNQAYIPYNHQDKVPGFFPDRKKPDDENCPMFRVLTKDFGSFHMRMAQQGNKALHSVESNAILGEWIRRKIGVASGGYVTKQMLELYGRTSVTFRKYSDELYLLDF